MLPRGVFISICILSFHALSFSSMAAFFTCLQLAGQPFPFAGYENGTSKCRVWQIAFPLLICMHSLLCLSPALPPPPSPPLILWNYSSCFSNEKLFQFKFCLGPTQQLNTENMTKSICNQCEMRNVKDFPLLGASCYEYSCDNHMKWTFMIFITCRWLMRSERSNLFTWLAII